MGGERLCLDTGLEWGIFLGLHLLIQRGCLTWYNEEAVMGTWARSRQRHGSSRMRPGQKRVARGSPSLLTSSCPLPSSGSATHPQKNLSQKDLQKLLRSKPELPVRKEVQGV